MNFFSEHLYLQTVVLLTSSVPCLASLLFLGFIFLFALSCRSVLDESFLNSTLFSVSVKRRFPFSDFLCKRVSLENSPFSLPPSRTEPVISAARRSSPRLGVFRQRDISCLLVLRPMPCTRQSRLASQLIVDKCLSQPAVVSLLPSYTHTLFRMCLSVC